MNYVQFSWMDYALFTAMFGLSFLTGIYFGCFGEQQTTKDYLHGGKRMKVLPVAISLVAGTISGIAMLGIPAEIYMYGTQYWMMVPAMACVGAIVYYTFLPVFYTLQLTSIFEYLELRYNKHLRTAFSFLFTLTNVLVLPMVVYAPSLALNQVTGFNIYIIATVTSAICIFYTTLGGVKAVVWADTLQFTITLCTLSFVLIKGTILVGGLSVTWEKAQTGDRIEFFNMDVNPVVRNTFWSVVLGNIATWSYIFGTHQGTMQRFLAVPTYNDCKRMLIIFIVLTVFVKTVGCFFGLIVYAKYQDCDPLSAGYIKKPDQILPYFVSDVAMEIPGLSGLFVCGLFTTALSTLSTWLNAASATFYTDVVSLFMPKDISDLTVSTILKLITLFVGAAVVGLVFVVERLGTLVQLTFSVTGFCGGPLLGLFLMGMIFPIANKKGAVYGAVISFSLMTIMVFGNQILTWNRQFTVVPKTLATYGCDESSTILPNTTFSNTTTDIINTRGDYQPIGEETFWLFRISFHYYTLLGSVITIVVGLIVSWITRKDSDPPVNPDLLCPLVNRLLGNSNLSTNSSSESNASDPSERRIINDKDRHVLDALLGKSRKFSL